MSYRTRVRVIEAFQWTGQSENMWPTWAMNRALLAPISERSLTAYTKNGPVRVEVNDWLILGDHEIYPCKDDEFHKRYEPAPTPETTFENVTGG